MLKGIADVRATGCSILIPFVLMQKRHKLLRLPAAKSAAEHMAKLSHIPVPCAERNGAV